MIQVSMGVAGLVIIVFIMSVGLAILAESLPQFQLQHGALTLKILKTSPANVRPGRALWISTCTLGNLASNLTKKSLISQFLSL